MRQQVTIDEIKDRLLAQLDAVVDRYAPPAKGAYTNKGRFFTLNPGRADRSVGSFCVWMRGQKAGRWNDYATGDHGDILDLIRLSLSCDAAQAIREAREFLGLDHETPELKRQRDEAAQKAKARRAAAERAERAEAARMRRAAYGLWMSAQADLTGTPVDLYLQGRGIDLATFWHMPHAIRYHPECRYYFDAELTDPTTGEVRKVSQWRPMPAMVTAIARGPDIIDCHRTYLMQDPVRGWVKADVPSAKKVFTDYTGGTIRLCGPKGPRGGMTKLKDAPPGSRAFLAEGIENALSLIALRALRGQDPVFVLAAGSIWNMGNAVLPPEVTDITLIADNDTGEQARAALNTAVGFHRSQGRTVRVWRSEIAGEDLNDALKRALSEGQQGAA